MSQLLGFLINGLSLGCVYALIALGFVIIFKSTQVLNFAHGSVLLLGVYVMGRLHGLIGFPLAVVAGIAAGAAVAMLIEFVVIRRARDADLAVLAILTLGVDTLILTEITREIGTDILSAGAPWGTAVVSVGGAVVPVSRLVAAAVTIIVVTTFGLTFKFSNWGIAMRAAAADPGTAALMGIRRGRIALAAWGLAGAVAAVAGVFLTSFPTPGITGTVGVTALGAIPAWVLGGFDSIPGAVLGGLIIGVVISLTDGYQQYLMFLGQGLSDAAPYIVMMLVLLVRPAGLLGTRQAIRV